MIIATQVLVDGCRQEVPYPAMCWQWRSIQSYPWKHPQHINALELTAFLNFVRKRVGSKDFHHKRFFHIFDSRVSACVAAKGRSSSKVLNRLCRRFAAFAIAADVLVLTLWTVSGWNHADAASRRPTSTG